MAMCTTIVAIRKKNIRHLYYGDPIHMVYRTSADYPNLQQLKLLKDDKELRESILKAAKQNYSPKKLDPAPAYRAVTASEMDGIVKRLYYNRVPAAAAAAAAAAAGTTGHVASAPAGGTRRDATRQPNAGNSLATRPPAASARNPTQLVAAPKSVQRATQPLPTPAS